MRTKHGVLSIAAQVSRNRIRAGSSKDAEIHGTVLHQPDSPKLLKVCAGEAGYPNGFATLIEFTPGLRQKHHWSPAGLRPGLGYTATAGRPCGCRALEAVTEGTYDTRAPP